MGEAAEVSVGERQDAHFYEHLDKFMERRRRQRPQWKVKLRQKRKMSTRVRTTLAHVAVAAAGITRPRKHRSSSRLPACLCVGKR